MTESVNARMVEPCPFCGFAQIEVYEGSTFRWRVARCEECGAQAGEVRIQTMGDHHSDEWQAAATTKALAEWNRRAALAEAESTDKESLTDRAAAPEAPAPTQQALDRMVENAETLGLYDEAAPTAPAVAEPVDDEGYQHVPLKIVKTLQVTAQREPLTPEQSSGIGGE